MNRRIRRFPPIVNHPPKLPPRARRPPNRQASRLAPPSPKPNPSSATAIPINSIALRAPTCPISRTKSISPRRRKPFRPATSPAKSAIRGRKGRSITQKTQFFSFHPLLFPPTDDILFKRSRETAHPPFPASDHGALAQLVERGNPTCAPHAFQNQGEHFAASLDPLPRLSLARSVMNMTARLPSSPSLPLSREIPAAKLQKSRKSANLF